MLCSEQAEHIFSSHPLASITKTATSGDSPLSSRNVISGAQLSTGNYRVMTSTEETKKQEMSV